MGARPDGRESLRVVTGLCSAEAVLVGVSVWGLAGNSSGLLALDISVGILSLILLPALRFWPLETGYLLALLAGLSMAATPVASAAVLHVARRRRLSEAVWLAAFTAAAHVIRFLWRPVSGLGLEWWSISVCAVATALVGWGAYGRSRCALISSLRERALRAEAEQARKISAARTAERGRIAREMHDVLAHRLTLLATFAGALEYRPETEPQKIAEAAGVIRSNVRDALVELRQVIYVLRDDDMADASLLADSLDRPQPRLEDVPELVDQARAAGAEVHLDFCARDAEKCPRALGRTAYRVVQEALTNARRHAAGASAHVIVEGEAGGVLEIRVRNALVAAAPETTGSGTGLIGLTERVSLAGGSVEYGAQDGEFRLHVVLPWAL